VRSQAALVHVRAMLAIAGVTWIAHAGVRPLRVGALSVRVAGVRVQSALVLLLAVDSIPGIPHVA